MIELSHHTCRARFAENSLEKCTPEGSQLPRLYFQAAVAASLSHRIEFATNRTHSRSKLLYMSFVKSIYSIHTIWKIFTRMNEHIPELRSYRRSVVRWSKLPPF